MISTQGAQYAQQFLTTALSQRGPSALPYAEDAKWLIRQHLVSLVDAFPSLHPKVSHFVHNDGRSALLLQAEGTIPIDYQGAAYNLPASIWLHETYPRSPPAVFLTPTQSMLVKPNHPLVDRSGSVHSPYLRSWLFPSSNLVDLVRSLSHAFSLDPPLYSRQTPSANPTPSPSPNASPIPQQSPSPSPSRVFSSSSPYTRSSAEDPAEVYRRNAISKLRDMIHGDLSGLRKSLEVEMEGLFTTQAALKQREEELRKGLREMQDEKEGLEQQLQLVLMNTDVLEGWVRENEGRGRIGDVDVEDAFQPSDPLSRQMLQCTASDLAVEDVIYSLDKAAQEGSIPFEMYLKNVRTLSREQFFHRATGAKKKNDENNPSCSRKDCYIGHMHGTVRLHST
ncbi:hypothetical protein J5N97_012816 [Dioscorea zingiberensis]|uniref:Protein ELC-like n=1 Tax=Dioscorea zingiberensis TaxID=325984 RepID=A0A9D5HIH3_9LILI|nr:hypothetical protein J5N97_012816 [Dioscorea zingiberensis]